MPPPPRHTHTHTPWRCPLSHPCWGGVHPLASASDMSASALCGNSCSHKKEPTVAAAPTASPPLFPPPPPHTHTNHRTHAYTCLADEHRSKCLTHLCAVYCLHHGKVGHPLQQGFDLVALQVANEVPLDVRRQHRSLVNQLLQHTPAHTTPCGRRAGGLASWSVFLA